ncbi:MAG: methyltransferase domain-containing protein [Gammaproteobacteria bacterium]|nr:methyltransferase domain-containing protein [Gammaproteobacteria bacterium]
MDWNDLTAWWLEELRTDSAYDSDVQVLLVDLLDARPGLRLLDLACGEGRVMSEMQSRGVGVIGCDLSHDLLVIAERLGPVVECRLPDLGWARAVSFDGAYASLVFEHLADLPGMFQGVSRVTRQAGVLATVMNHPLSTASESGPVVDPTDGELFWRWGSYLSGGTTSEPAGEAAVTFFHRSLSELLNMAADAGWILEHLIERSVTGDDPFLGRQAEIPRLLGIRWRKP